MPLDIITLNQWLFSALLLGGILFLGLFHIVIYLVRKKLSIHLFFGMICISFVVWYVSTVATFDLYPFNLLNDQHKQIIAVMCTTQMILYLNLYTMGILRIKRPAYEKGLKIWANTLFIACLFMPLSAIYMAILTFVIQVFNAIAQLYIVYDLLKVIKRFLKDIRVLNIIFFLSTCTTSVMEVFGFHFRNNTIYLAFVMLCLQAIILAIHYNQSIIQVEQANVTLEGKVKERTKELVQKETETIELISSISHDLRTPIAVVGGYMELLQNNPWLDEANQTYIQNSQMRLWQMEKLTLDLFTLSQMSDRNFTLELEQVKIARIIEQVETLYKVQGQQKGVTVYTQTEDVVCIADKMRLIQILDNLVVNALSYASTRVSIDVKSVGEWVEIAVSDDGAGIQPNELPYVFDRFYKKRQQGSGIGLSIVKDLVQRMNGDVAVESELHIGTTFTFTLPLTSES
ncbi:sensor histidine kinase [Sporosarcina sp. FSL K6-3457]|uniref:sensor histidine kinase n=1 Tax=Sporosarcina sp. FSL K6-3457 TaxID=2978204 RepID=UPI0030F6AA3D